MHSRGAENDKTGQGVQWIDGKIDKPSMGKEHRIWIGKKRRETSEIKEASWEGTDFLPG